MDEAKKLEDVAFLESNLARQLEWVRAAESRLSLVLPLSTALFGTIAVRVSDASGWDCYTVIATAVAVLLLGGSILFSALSFVPQVKGAQVSNIFFGTVGAMPLSDFRAALAEYGEEEYRRDLIEQIHINARIAARKYRLVTYSMRCLMGSFLPWAISMIFIYG